MSDADDRRRRSRRRRDEPGMGFRELIGYQSEGPLKPMPSGKGGPSLGQGAPPSGHSAQAIAYLARTVGGNEGGNGANIATLIDGLVSDGVWAKLDALYILAQQNVTDARLNLVSVSYPLTGSATFTAYQGFSAYTGNGLDTGFNPTTAPSPNFTQNSASVGVWTYTTPETSETFQLGNSNVVFGTNLTLNFSGLSYINLNGSFTSGPSYPGNGLFSADRSSSAQAILYWGGANIYTNVSTSGAGPNVDIFIGSDNVGNRTSATLSEAHIGASLGAAGQLALYNRLNTYMTAVAPPATSVWSAADAAANAMTLSNGGLTVAATKSAVNQSVRGSIGKTAGKLYVEFLAVQTTTNAGFGGASAGFNANSYLGSTNYSGGVFYSNTLVSAGFTSNYSVTTGTVAATGDVIAIAIDFTAGNIWGARNNVWVNSSNPATGSLPIMSFVPATVGALFPGMTFQATTGEVWTLQPTAASQKYAPPAGFTPWG